MIIKRDLINKIIPFLKRPEFISIVGPRQCGKTTFLEILSGYLRRSLKIPAKLIKTITFEDRKLLMEFNEDPVIFVKSFIPSDISGKFYLMIDEFQYADDGGKKLKFIYDTFKTIKIIVTGSSSLDIKARVGKFMVGRMLNFELSPFNFYEYLLAHNKRMSSLYVERSKAIEDYILRGKRISIKGKKDAFSPEFIPEYEEFVIWGGYPAVVLANTKVEKKKLLRDLYSSYVLKDIKTLLQLATERNLFLLSQYLATQIGNVVVYQNLSQASGLSYRKLVKHLNILKETFVCCEVKPFFRNKQKELSKNPKFYFFDLGFRNSLIDSMGSLRARPDSGSIVENAGFIRLKEIYTQVNRIHFWRTKAGAEIDFIICGEDRITPVEVKYTTFTSEKLSRGFISFIDALKPERALVLTRDYWGMVKRGRTEVLFAPVYYL